MKKQKISAKTVALLAMMIALALGFSYVETLIPINFGIPGVKLGLANLVIVAALYLIGGKEAFLVSVVRIFLSGFMFGFYHVQSGRRSVEPGSDAYSEKNR